MFGFKRPHPWEKKKEQFATARDWAILKGHADITDEGDRKYWRIHDDLYDLSKFDHPGGVEWIRMSQGNDITELFESSHPNIEKVRALLPKYKVGEAKEPRNSGAFTFNKNGFYSTMRERAWNILKTSGTGPSLEMLMIHDGLLLTFLMLFVLAINPNLTSTRTILLYCILNGFVLQCLGTCSHNFYHVKLNWRMFTWDLTPYASNEWRISHCYSHHTFPNTAYDYEIMVFEPHVMFYPKEKTLAYKIIMPFIFQLMTMIGMHLQVYIHTYIYVDRTVICQ